MNWTDDLSQLCRMSACQFCSPNGDILCRVDDMLPTCFGHVGDMTRCRVSQGVQNDTTCRLFLFPTCPLNVGSSVTWNSAQTYSFVLYMLVPKRATCLCGYWAANARTGRVRYPHWAFLFLFAKFVKVCCWVTLVAAIMPTMPWQQPCACQRCEHLGQRCEHTSTSSAIALLFLCGKPPLHCSCSQSTRSSARWWRLGV